MQFVLTMTVHSFCFMYKRDGILQIFNKKSHMNWDFNLKFEPSFKQQIPFIQSISEKLHLPLDKGV